MIAQYNQLFTFSAPSSIYHEWWVSEWMLTQGRSADFAISSSDKPYCICQSCLASAPSSVALLIYEFIHILLMSSIKSSQLSQWLSVRFLICSFLLLFVFAFTFVSIHFHFPLRRGGAMEGSMESPVAEFYRDKTVFITGATGFMGKVDIKLEILFCLNLWPTYQRCWWRNFSEAPLWLAYTCSSGPRYKLLSVLQSDGYLCFDLIYGLAPKIFLSCRHAQDQFSSNLKPMVFFRKVYLPSRG